MATEESVSDLQFTPIRGGSFTRGQEVETLSEWCIFCNEVHRGECPIVGADQRSAIDSAVAVERERCIRIVTAVLQEIDCIDKDAWDIVTKIRSGE